MNISVNNIEKSETELLTKIMNISLGFMLLIRSRDVARENFVQVVLTSYCVFAQFIKVKLGGGGILHKVHRGLQYIKRNKGLL
jgi:hypothetical protein